MKALAAAAFTALTLALLASPARADFEWVDTEGVHLDLVHGNRSIARYMYEALDESSEERREQTYKPFCHIFQWWSGEEFITNGAGGRFPHHRGIFYGFSRVSYTDAAGETHERVDTWHCREAAQIHREFTAKEAGADSASFTSRIEWIGRDGKAFASEDRTMGFSLDGDDVVVDFESTLTPLVPQLRLDGDPQHAGFHFRAHNDVNEETAKGTYYIRPGTGKGAPGTTVNWSEDNDTEHTRDQAWKAMCFTLGTAVYTVAYLDHPGNPKPARYSERDYGRFGSYFEAEATPEEPVSVRYRLVIRRGEMEPGEVEQFSAAFLAE